MLGLVGCTTMRPIAPDFSSPVRFQVRPPSVDLKMPQPGEIVLRESSSPVPAHTCIVSDGAIASSPIDTHFSLSNTGRNVVPALLVFQMPPAAAATKNVFDGPGRRGGGFGPSVFPRGLGRGRPVVRGALGGGGCWGRGGGGRCAGCGGGAGG